MKLFPAEKILINQTKIDNIESLLKSVLRLVIYSRAHMADDILDTYLTSIIDLNQVVAMKNAQMEAQNEEEAEEYLVNLKSSIEFIAKEINEGQNFERELQLFQLLRIISPETNARHPNKYRQTDVMVGGHLCPDPYLIPGLMSELFYQMATIPNPIVRSIYMHHEMIRIHPFADGNGRATRIAKNWILMFALYPPIFIDSVIHKSDYISILSQSFKELKNNSVEWNVGFNLFFEQQLNIMQESIIELHAKINSIGIKRSLNGNLI